MKKKVLLCARYSVVEPLGLLVLSEVARQEGWGAKIALVKDSGFENLDATIREYNPDLLGFELYTGGHMSVLSYLDKLRSDNKKIKIALGGPHPTYFPRECKDHADYVAISEGLNTFRRILRDEVSPGIIPLTRQEDFPIPDRTEFYRDNKEHGESGIKSIITGTGCPYTCTYCYNSSTLGDIANSLNPDQLRQMKRVLNKNERLFPMSHRSVDDVVAEAEHIMNVSPSTKLIFFQDDVFGANLNWLREFREKYRQLGIKFHAQMRFEFANPDVASCRERIELMKDAGCNGLTFAIESAIPTIRKEVLRRPMNEDLMFKVFHFLERLGYGVRTEQMLGLPYGATSEPTKVNLDADLETLRLNVRLRAETGLPTMAWASIFVPYHGTKISRYCLQHGFYSGWNDDVPETFFERSVLEFPKRWIGPNLSPKTREAWLSKAELVDYKSRLQDLRDYFITFARTERGDELATEFLKLPHEKRTSYNLSTLTRRHLYDAVLYKVK